MPHEQLVDESKQPGREREPSRFGERPELRALHLIAVCAKLAGNDLALERGADVLRLVAVRVPHDQARPTVNRKETHGPDKQTRLFPDFAHRGVGRRVCQLDGPARGRPLASLALLNEQNTIVLVADDAGNGRHEESFRAPAVAQPAYVARHRHGAASRSAITYRLAGRSVDETFRPDSAIKSPTVRALVGLALGLVVGALITWSNSTIGARFTAVVEPIGTIWVNALRMTVIPLVVSLLVSTLASSRSLESVGRLGRDTFVVFVVLLVAIAVVGLALAIPVYSWLQVDPASSAALRASTATTAAPATAPSFASWVSGLVPSNAIAAARDGAMLPLLIFAVLLGLAAGRLDEVEREPIVTVFRALADAMLVVVRWVLFAAPAGAFALALSVATHLGNATAAVMLFYVVSHAALLVVVGLLLYGVIPVVTRTPLARFARSLLPAQVVVVATRSSLAALPAMLDGAERVLQVPPSVAGFTLPLGVSLLRASTGLSWVVYALFLGKLYGIPLTVTQLVGVAAIGIVMSFAVPGIPSGGLLIATPYFMAVGLPPQGIGILIALDAIPDIFKTLVIVMCHMSATLIVAQRASVAHVRGLDAEPLPAPASSI